MGGNTRFKPRHGMRGSIEYRIWSDMLNRCRNPKVKSYARYGGKGIRVCARWHKFEHFYADMGARPSTNHSIERDKICGDYEPKNCRWILKPEQQANKSTTRWTFYNGERIQVTNLCRRLGKNRSTILKRLDRGMTIEEAIAC